MITIDYNQLFFALNVWPTIDARNYAWHDTNHQTNHKQCEESSSRTRTLHSSKAAFRWDITDSRLPVRSIRGSTNTWILIATLESQILYYWHKSLIPLQVNPRQQSMKRNPIGNTTETTQVTAKDKPIRLKIEGDDWSLFISSCVLDKLFEELLSVSLDKTFWPVIPTNDFVLLKKDSFAMLFHVSAPAVSDWLIVIGLTWASEIENASTTIESEIGSFVFMFAIVERRRWNF